MWTILIAFCIIEAMLFGITVFHLIKGDTLNPFIDYYDNDTED